MDALFLIVVIAGQRVAMPANHVESVIEIDQITPVPLVAPPFSVRFSTNCTSARL